MTVVLQFSGGKDSLACLHLCKDIPNLVAYWVDTGAPFPHMRDFVRNACRQANVPLRVIHPPMKVQDWQLLNGYPADIVPVNALPEMKDISKDEFPARIVSYMTCCATNIWGPLAQATVDSGAKEVVRGSKRCDSRVGVEDGYVDDQGIIYYSPIWDWSDDQVMAYLREIGVEPAPQYVEGCDSLDCWSCTAYMEHHGVKRFAWLKAHYPDLYEEAARRMKLVKATLKRAQAGISLDV